MKKLTIAIQSDGAVYKSGNQYYCNSPFLFFAKEIGSFFDKTCFVIPVQKSSEKRDVFKIYDNQSIVPLKPYSGVMEYYSKLPFYLIKNSLAMFSAIRKSDVVFLRIPSMNAILAFTLSLIFKKKIVTYCVGNEVEIVSEGGRYSGKYIGSVALGIAKFHRLKQKMIVKKASVAFFLGSELRDKLGGTNKNSHITFTSLIRSSDITYRSVCTKKEINLLYIGRLGHEKGIHYLIEAYKNIAKTKKNVKLFIAGDGECLRELQEDIALSGLTSNVIFLGHQTREEIDRTFLNCDIMILPSLSEGVPKVLLEAMTKGLPVVATSVGGIPDIIENMKNGVLVPSKSHEEITKAVELIIDDRDLRENIVKNGYSFVKEHTMEKQAKQIAGIIYRQVANIQL